MSAGALRRCFAFPAHRWPHRHPAALLLLALALVAASPGTAAEAAAASPAAALPSRFAETQREYVHAWIRQLVPACPREAADDIVDRFLEELQRQAPGDLERLLTPGFPARQHQSRLLRLLGAQLKAPAQAALREEAARLRLQAILELEAGGPSSRVVEGTAALARIKAMAPVHPRRLFEGRMDDDEIALLLKKSREHAAGATPATSAPPKPKVLTAGDIVAEFTRRNQEGAAAQRLRALAVEIDLESPAGERMKIHLYRLRPDRFRMAVVVGDGTRAITACDGTRYWQQVPERSAREIPAKAVGELRHLREIVDPLFGEAGVTFERLSDRVEGDTRLYRIAVRRPDGSGHVAWIEPEDFRQVGRETEDQQIVRYSDFRLVAGVTLAFREELTDAQGRKTRLTLVHATPDSGLIPLFFEMPPAGQPDFFALEKMLPRPPPVAVPK